MHWPISTSAVNPNQTQPSVVPCIGGQIYCTWEAWRSISHLLAPSTSTCSSSSTLQRPWLTIDFCLPLQVGRYYSGLRVRRELLVLRSNAAVNMYYGPVMSLSAYLLICDGGRYSNGLFNFDVLLPGDEKTIYLSRPDSCRQCLVCTFLSIVEDKWVKKIFPFQKWNWSPERSQKQW